MKTILAADLFAGAGGATTSLRRACDELGLGLSAVAVNHWPIAVKTHSLNHPEVQHFCETVEQANPRECVPGGRLHVLLAGPSCTHHSRARGGRPVNDQARTSAWHILRWCQELYVDNVIIENVEEFRSWSPVGLNGKPLKRRTGETYNAFLAALRSLGYRVEDRILNAADYGDPTTRRRLFIVARRGGRPIRWPEPTHAPTGVQSLFGGLQPWRSAREIIDWSIPGKSIFRRKKPLKPKTMARILAGLERFGGSVLKPFIVVLRANMGARPLNEPLPTIVASGQHIGLCEPFVLQQQSGGAPRSTRQPLPTLAAKGAQALVQPFLVPLYGERKGQAPRTHSVDEPVPTIPATGSGKFLVVEPLITSYYSGSAGASRVSEPLPTVTTKDRFGLVLPVVDGQALDIHFRMLRPHELARAMSFGDEYQFAGNQEQVVRQIGNAWPCRLGQALVESMLRDYATERRSAELRELVG